MPDAATGNNREIIDHDLSTSIQALRESQEQCHDILASINAGIQSLVHMATKDALLPDADEMITLQGGRDYVLDRKGRRFICIWCAVLVSNVSIAPYGITGYTANLAPGFNVLNYPDRTVLTVPAGTNVNAFWRATNSDMSGAI